MNTYRVEFNTTGFYEGQGIFDTCDELTAIEANTAEEAIECAKEWWIDSAEDKEQATAETEEFAWRAAKKTYDCDRYLNDYEWEVI